MPDMMVYKEMILSWLAVNGLQLLIALIIIAVGAWISRKISNLAERGMTSKGIDPLLVGFLGNLVFYILMVCVFLAAMSRLGINTNSFLAIVGTMGLAIGLAVKDNLANFSSGVILILFRPFTLGDYVSVAGVAGTVEKITLSNTLLLTPDNQKIIVPNNKITGEVITNVTAKDTRRIDLVVGIGYGDDIKKAKSVLEAVVTGDDRVLKEPGVQIAVSELADSSVNFVVRPWVKTSEYWAVRFDLTEAIKLALDENGISIPFPQRDVHLDNVN